MNDEKKMSLKEFIWMGFNYTVGVGFIGNLAIFSNIIDSKGNINVQSTGLHIFWIFGLLGFIASICALAFAKLSTIHKSDNNGGTYLYARTAFGRFTGLMVAFIQYVMLPFIIAYQIWGLLKTFLLTDLSGLDWGFDKIPNLGNWSSLVLDVLGIIIYFAFALVIFGGMKWFKKMANYSSAVKWATSFVLILAGIVMAFMNGSSNYQMWNHSYNESIHGLSFNAFSKAFVSCFFFFSGFESFATAGKNIKDPEKNLAKGIMITMLVSSIFYIVIMAIFFAAVNPKQGFSQNMTTGLWNMHPISQIKWLSVLGVVIMFISQIALRANTSVQNALYGGTMLQPMAVEGFISEKYNKLNKDNIPVKASLLNIYVILLVSFIWLIIPDIIYGFQKPGTKLIFNVAQLTEASSAIIISLYIISVLALIKTAILKYIKLRIWEWISFSFALILLVVLFFYHYYALFDVIVKYANKNSNIELEDLIGAIVELLFVIISLAFAIIWYFTYYNKKLKQRLSTTQGRKLQEQLDAEFVLINTQKPYIRTKK
ncbi:APC family permease [Mycoplasma mycoides subsp. capri]|uniref:APC family permease n=2 Tax=Mycoplasma mycoides TaxID=2102 RepID=UPI00223F1DDF|nr:APC family permease [Mycoplasma mycoides]QVK00452.1 APC family permease [Mycoplasma mycoides subsp. capri]QVK01338.1 APC family permease [Mycoplasma mycoides subsp. capri]